MIFGLLKMHVMHLADILLIAEAKKLCGNGNYADIGVFHPVKHIACGEGGMLTTNSKNI